MALRLEKQINYFQLVKKHQCLKGSDFILAYGLTRVLLLLQC